MSNEGLNTLYLGERDCRRVPVVWEELVLLIERASLLMEDGKISQPIKPYVRFEEERSRIIALPARLGTSRSGGAAGLKWIASFPSNLDRGLPRAHSVSILNDIESGYPLMIAKAAELSVVRTAAVSATLLKWWLSCKDQGPINVGIIGLGPIGKSHLAMLAELLDSRIGKVRLYDLDGSRIADARNSICLPSIACESWVEAYCDSDIIVTATTSSKGYINMRPMEGALVLNVSLRDYSPDCMEYVDVMVVDDWGEVCREGTDIEAMSKCGLTEEDTVSLRGIVKGNVVRPSNSSDVVMFNPMGLAIYDVAIMQYYYSKALELGIGTHLG